MAHPNIDQRRDFIAQNYNKINESELVVIASKKFDCTKSAIKADIIQLIHTQNRSNKTIYPSPRMKKLIRERDKVCQYCGTSDKKNVFVIDHVLPASLGGCAIESNLVLACQSCNTKKKGRYETPNNIDLLLKLKQLGR